MPSKKLIGEYTYYDFCRFCGSTHFSPVIDLGYVPLAGGFFPAKTPQKILNSERLFPLQVCFCADCYLLQTNAVINRDTLFQNYFYHTSAIKTLVQHFSQLAHQLAQECAPPQTFVVEIGANDGSFITALGKEGFKSLGVDPATNVVQPVIDSGVPIINEYFSEKIAEQIVQKHGQANYIFSFNTLAHIEDMHDVFRGIKKLLHATGYLAFEIHYVGSVIDEVQYDMIYHEHQYYYSVLALQNFCKQYDLEIFDVLKVPTHAGSIRIYVQHAATGHRPISQQVAKIVHEEVQKGYQDKKTFISFGKKIAQTKKDLLQLLDSLQKQGKRIVGYGASGRGTIISNYCGLSKKYLEYVIDDAPAKQGVITPGVHLPVYTSARLTTPDRPDYVLLFAWSFFAEIQARNTKYLASGGKFIVPLPEVKIVS